MTRLLTAVSDRLLGTVAPKAEASAACSPSCWYQYRCVSSTTRYERRRVCRDYYCHYTYGSWQLVSKGC